MEATLPKSQPKPIVPYPTLKESWGVVGWFLLVFLVGMGGLMAVLRITLTPEQQANIPALGLIVLGNLLLLFLLYKLYGSRWQPLSLLGKAPIWLYQAIPLLTVGMVIVLSLQSFLSLPNWGKAALELISRHPVQAMVGGGIVIPVLEEVLFRGIMLPGLLRHQRPWLAIGQQALLFGLVHFNPVQSLNAFFIGLLLGWLYYRTSSLLVVIGIHALNNLAWFAASIWLPQIARDSTTLPALLGSNWAYAGMVALAAGVLGLLLWCVSLLALPVAWTKSADSFQPNPES